MVNPITDKPSGAFPFRTDTCGVRSAIADILEKTTKNCCEIESISIITPVHAM